MANNTPHASEASAEVSSEQHVQLFNLDNRTILAPVADVERWLAEGWSRSPFDVTEAVAEALLQFNVARDLFAEAVESIRSDGEINPQDVKGWATFSVAFADLANGVALVRSGLFAMYPIHQGVPVSLVNLELAEDDPQRAIEVDPSQVEGYLEAGYVEVEPGE